MVGLWRRFYALKDAPRELWLVYLLKTLESFADFATSLNLVLYLSLQFSYSDSDAGLIYGTWGLCTGVFGMILGPFIDKLGIRYSLMIGGTLTTLGRALLAGGTSKAQVILSLFILQPAGMALAIPVLSIAIRRTTTNETRAIAYGLFYACMNVAALISGLSTDALAAYLRDTCGQVCSIRCLFWISTVVSILYTLIAIFIFRELPVTKHIKPSSYAQALPDAAELLGAPQEPLSLYAQARETCKDAVFWRLVVFSGLLFGARSIFRHVDTTIPKWMRRTIGLTAKFGSMSSINPAIVILTVSLVQAHLAAYDPYTVIQVGTTIVVAAPLSLFLLPASYISVTLFMVLLSIGEVIYSPKLYEFALILAPPGKEGVYGTLAAAPLFVVRLISGASSGKLLQSFCPADAPSTCHSYWAYICQVMWLFIALIAVTTPIALTLIKPWLYNAEVKARLRSQIPDVM